MGKIKVIQGDITKVEVDAIVNAANTSLLGGGGVDGAIHRAGGAAILEECQKIRNRQGGCRVGEAVMTTAGNLPSEKVIHTVGPRWNEGRSNESSLLENAYLNSLKLAVKHEIQSIAFPNISTGIYRFPKEKAASIAVATISDFLQSSDQIQNVIIVCFDAENFELYNALLGE
jgi:O-acetyl-ADP-ribose deacetylase (regulator of RNase III)